MSIRDSWREATCSDPSFLTRLRVWVCQARHDRPISPMQSARGKALCTTGLCSVNPCMSHAANMKAPAGFSKWGSPLPPSFHHPGRRATTAATVIWLASRPGSARGLDRAVSQPRRVPQLYSRRCSIAQPARQMVFPNSGAPPSFWRDWAPVSPGVALQEKKEARTIFINSKRCAPATCRRIIYRNKIRNANYSYYLYRTILLKPQEPTKKGSSGMKPQTHGACFVMKVLPLALLGTFAHAQTAPPKQSWKRSTRSRRPHPPRRR